jgi:flagellar basal body-associated protein FliL
MRIFSKILPIFVVLAFAPPAMAASHEAARETIAGAPSYVRFPAIFVPIIEGDRVTRQIGVRLTLELAQAQEKQAVEEKRLELNDAFVRDLYAFFQQRAAVKANDIDEMYLKGRLLKVADNVIGEKAVREVLIEQFFEQKK